MNICDKYDVVIVGAGVSGAALLYILSKYTNVKRIAILDRYESIASLNSNSKSNSQTLHFGDIETNYTLEKASKVKEAAEMVKTYLGKSDREGEIYKKYNKMALAVGEREVKDLRKRYEEFKNLFPNIKLLKRDEIAKIEPSIVKGRKRDEQIIALNSEDGYTVDYGALAKSFIEKAKNNLESIDVYLNTPLEKIEKENGEKYKIITNNKIFYTKTAAITSGAESLLIAKSLGYGKDFSLLSVAGNFYFTDKLLNGKVYTCQMPKLPFAAIHGDPEVHNSNITRFGPTANPIFLLERHNYKTFFKYIKSFGLNYRSFSSLINLMSDWIISSYIIKNSFFLIPFLGKRLFIKHVRKIVPEVKLKDLKKARGIGGLRPQVMNLKEKHLDHGEAKIYGDNIIFNITPSPGASTCLKNAEIDAKKIVNFLGEGYIFNQEEFSDDFKNNF